MQTPNLVNGQIVKQAETDIIIAAIRSINQLVRDLLLAQLNAVIPGGFALSAATGTPILVNYAQGVVVLSGYDIAVPAGTLTVSAADPTFHRYDLLTIAYSQTTPTDSAGQPTTLDTATPTVVKGTAGASPALPPLPAGSAQIGWIDVPPGVTSATQCVLYPAPGPLVPNNLQDLTTHIAASMASAAVHGFHVDAQGGVTPGRIPQLDAMGAVQRAQTVIDAASISHPAAQSGQHPLGYLAVYDNATGRVEDSKLLAGQGPSAYQPAGNYATLDGNNRVTDSEAVRGLRFARGSASFSAPANGLSGVTTCALSDSSFTPLGAEIQIVNGPAWALTPYRVALAPGSVTFTVFSDGAAFSGTTDILAWG